MRSSFYCGVAFWVALVGCGSDVDKPEDCGEKCDAVYDDDDSCAIDGLYANGTCDLGCPQPDVDCFAAFDDYYDAAAWYRDHAGGDGPSLLAADDPRRVKLQNTVDEGWRVYRSIVRTGELIVPPMVLLVDDDSENAFVICDGIELECGHIVVIHTGTVEADLSTDQIMGLVFHELEHIVATHGLVSDQHDQYYRVTGTDEPLGLLQDNDPAVQKVVQVWRERSEIAGSPPAEEFNNLPANDESVAGKLLLELMDRGSTVNGDACTPMWNKYVEWLTLRGENTGLLDGTIHVADAASSFDTVTGELRQETATCTEGVDVGFMELASEVFNVTEQQIRDELTTEDLALVDGHPAREALIAWISSSYEHMRALEAMLDFSTVRYYSTEEAADDRSVQVLGTMGLNPAGVGEFMLVTMSPEAQEQCRAIIADGDVPPYGDLSDDHHASCWRLYHARAVAKHFGFGSTEYRRGAKRVHLQNTQSSAAELLRRRGLIVSDCGSAATHR